MALVGARAAVVAAVQAALQQMITDEPKQSIINHLGHFAETGKQRIRHCSFTCQTELQSQQELALQP